jgi:hypothetical protein
MVRYRSMNSFSKICTVEIEIALAGSFATMAIVAVVEGDIFDVNGAA